MPIHSGDPFDGDHDHLEILNTPAEPRPKLCPVCGKIMTVDISHIDDYYSPVCEQYEDCPTGHYNYEFAYGHIRVNVGNEEFSWSYNGTDEEFRAFTEGEKDAIRRLKTAQNKDTTSC